MIFSSQASGKIKKFGPKKETHLGFVNKCSYGSFNKQSGLVKLFRCTAAAVGLFMDLQTNKYKIH